MIQRPGRKRGPEHTSQFKRGSGALSQSALLVVVFHHDAVDNFLLDVVLPRQLRLPIRTRPCTPPPLHRWRVLVFEAPHDPHPPQHRTLRERAQHNIVVCHREIERADAGMTALVRRGLHDAVNRRFVEATREEFHAIARVDDERVRDVLDEAPHTVRGENLERGHGLGPEDSDSSEVGVALEPDVGRLALLLGGAGIAANKVVRSLFMRVKDGGLRTTS